MALLPVFSRNVTVCWPLTGSSALLTMYFPVHLPCRSNCLGNSESTFARNIDTAKEPWPADPQHVAPPVETGFVLTFMAPTLIGIPRNLIPTVGLSLSEAMGYGWTA